MLFLDKSIGFLLFFTARKRSLGQGNIFRSVCPRGESGPGGGACSRGCLLHGVVPAPREVSASGGFWSQEGALGGSGPRGVPGGDPPTATAAGGTHPTGMHSCFIYE